MKKVFILFISLILGFGVAEASKKTAKAGGVKKTAAGSEYSTKMSFEGTSLKGKVQSGSLRKIVVENDKSLDDLLGVRKHFDDREQQEKGRVTAW